MQVAYLDLINICRVCRSPNQDGDYVCLYEALTTVGEMLPALSNAGKLYGELFVEISPETYGHYPRYLCNCCDLQMRLFRKLQDKALKTIKYLSHMCVAKEDADETVFLDDEEMSETPLIEENAEDQNECSPQMGYKLQDVKIVSDMAPNLRNESHEGQQQYSDLELDLNEQVYKQEDNPQYDQFQFNSIEHTIHNPTQKQGHIEETSLPHCPLEADIPENGDVVIPDPDLSSVMDKSDYVLEIYELLEDGSKTVHSENIVEGEEVGDIDDFKDFEIEVGTESQLGLDEQYIDDDMRSSDGSAQEYKPSRQRRAAKRKLQNDNRKREYKCTECSEIFTNTKDFKYHRDYIHVQVYSCHICSSTFKSPYSLPTHMKIHDENPAFQCEICQRTFTQKAHYQYHMNRHNNIRNFKCEQCHKAFIGKTDLKIHMRQHNGDRPYVCEICGKDYMLSEHLKTHAIKHTGQLFPCELCQQNFATPKTLRQHKQTIHSSEAKFKCHFCLKPFKRKHHLQYHMKQLHPSTDILSESLYDIIDDPGEMDNFNDEDDDVTVDDDLVGNDEFIEDPGYVALSDDTILI